MESRSGQLDLELSHYCDSTLTSMMADGSGKWKKFPRKTNPRGAENQVRN
jgi:hypothetical protein